MQARTLTPVAIFGFHVRYVVPLFQRPYVWNREDQWQPLWEDVRAVAERLLTGSPTDVPPHFLGAIVLDHSPNPAGFIAAKSVIDGQQRLTTLQILLDAAQLVAAKFGREIDAKALRVLVVNDPEITQEPSEVFKVWPTNRDREAFRAAMSDEVSVTGALALTPIAKAHAFFAETITKWVLTSGGPDVTRERITALTHSVREHLKMVVIDLEHGDNSQVIFETLNHRGAPLLAADLIKNLVFQVAEAQGLDVDQLYEQHWVHLDTDYWRQRVARGRQFIPRIDIFVNYWLVMRLIREVPSDRIFVEFRDHLTSARPNVELLLSELADDARTFAALESMPRTTATGRFRYRVLEAMDSAAVTPLLLWLVQWPEHQLSRGQRDMALAAIESWLVRRALCRLTNKEVPRMVIDLLRALHAAGPPQAGQVTESFLAEQTLDTRFWPTDDMVVDSLAEAPVYRMLLRARLRMLLEAIEDEMRSGMAEHQACPLNLTVEHVMPRAWREHWPIDPPDEIAAMRRDRRVHTLGNLTLVTEKLNPALSNLPWTREDGKSKRAELLRHSVLKLNASLVAAHEKEWTESAIAERTTALAAAAIRIWHRPTSLPGAVDLDKAEKDAEPLAGDEAEPTVPAERYRALTEWLLDQTLDNIAITFTEIEDALGLPLPGRARIDTAYWRRSRTELANAIAAGRYRATGVQLAEERLVLTRLAAGEDT